ncbi:hypothetical protein [Micromonospora sagamiensis]|uniref:PH (Pleckstrin Homology) domain-containing protein n=1 Tax=Micromonospora sagamiensis TaxID=47875 RepID=A0A562WJH0_9ACTN|nr:hypothetical protein [Micromonospora sagamiensis]TWJ30335.1 hypothetical protein JD81_03873 [Micromonospora sagamiensis]BCL16635.1 hypothetical protein GCM10017556_43740 [Micromonospora sagamiensis]
MLTYAMPPLFTWERTHLTQRAYFPVPGTRLAFVGVLLVLTDVRLVFAPARLLKLPGFGECAVQRRWIDLRDVATVEPVGRAGVRIRTRSGRTVFVRVVLPTGPAFIWSSKKPVTPYRDETVRQITEACARAADACLQ